MSYPSVSLPDYFITLLKSNMPTKAGFVYDMINYINHHPAMLGLIRKYFKDIDEELRLDVILKSMGWENFRNRMALIYINYAIKHSYDDHLDNSYMVELLSLENQVKAHTTSDNSRAFMLSFYKIMGKIHLEKNLQKKQFCKLPVIGNQTIQLLKMANGKVVKVDIILVILELLQEFIGEKAVKEILIEKYPFSAAFDHMDSAKREAFVTGLLSYGQSVFEVDLFVKDTV